MKIRYNVYTILIVFLLFVQQIISGCTTTVTKNLQKDDLYRGDVQKENLISDHIHKEDLLKDRLRKEEADLVSQTLFRDKCSLCHELPDINAYSYTPDQWKAVIDNMHDAKEAGKFISAEEEEKIKVYLGSLSQTK